VHKAQASSAPLARSNRLAGLRWAALTFLFVIVVFGVVLIGHTPKWPIYVTILVWWAFVIYTTIHINHEKDAAISAEKPVSPAKVFPIRLS
jgi:hypothetical protein